MNPSWMGIPEAEKTAEVDPSGQVERTLFAHRELLTVMADWNRRWPPTAEDVRSPLFHELMFRYVYAPPDLNEARDQTDSYRFRHSANIRHVLGVWRWRGLYDAREEILPLLESAERILDHGGGACPLGFGAEVIDSDVELRTARGPYDVVFSSHTLEHCPDLFSTELELIERLRPGGTLIIHVPAWTAPHWRAGTVRKNDALHGPHLYNFFATGDYVCERECPPPAIHIPHSRYVGDNSILAVWRKPNP